MIQTYLDGLAFGLDSLFWLLGALSPLLVCGVIFWGFREPLSVLRRKWVAWRVQRQFKKQSAYWENES